ncbi:MAG: hypothetical protein PHE17_12785 [Thiothrix sp.]|uniref:hypothetical protein n=1 Tax=Thiothrix sp. TaxID=1032 RepID=UPI0026151263|nr:hypothetical protein [Thiothrix sp.]MDD5393887.1 hypothetical protein [Thiothrix sp.]
MEIGNPQNLSEATIFSAYTGEPAFFWDDRNKELNLWKTDGASKNDLHLATFPVNNHSDFNGSLPKFHALGERVLFWVDDGKHGFELWASDGTQTGTQLLVNASLAYEPTSLQTATYYYFIANDSGQGYTNPATLWRTDGTAAGTQAIAHFAGGEYFSLIDSPHDGLLIVSKSNAAMDTLTLFSLNTETTQQQHIHTFKGNAPLVDGSHFFGKYLYFALSDMGQHDPDEWWRTDLTDAGTQRLLSVPLMNGEWKEAPHLFSFGQYAYYMAMDGIRPAGLWQTDGTAAGTKALLESKGGQYNGDSGQDWPAIPVPFVVRGDKLIFPTFSQHSPYSRQYSQLWSLSSTHADKLVLLGEFMNPMLLRPHEADHSSPLYFSTEHERWQTDGTPAGTKVVGIDPLRTRWKAHEWKDSEGIGTPFPLNTTPPTWLVTYDDPQHGWELWVTDSTLKNTHRLALNK